MPVETEVEATPKETPPFWVTKMKGVEVPVEATVKIGFNLPSTDPDPWSTESVPQGVVVFTPSLEALVVTSTPVVLAEATEVVLSK